MARNSSVRPSCLGGTDVRAWLLRPSATHSYIAGGGRRDSLSWSPRTSSNAPLLPPPKPHHHRPNYLGSRRASPIDPFTIKHTARPHQKKENRKTVGVSSDGIADAFSVRQNELAVVALLLLARWLMHARDRQRGEGGACSGADARVHQGSRPHILVGKCTIYGGGGGGCGGACGKHGRSQIAQISGSEHQDHALLGHSSITSLATP